jgi:hypothetical protein
MRRRHDTEPELAEKIEGKIRLWRRKRRRRKLWWGQANSSKALAVPKCQFSQTLIRLHKLSPKRKTKIGGFYLDPGRRNDCRHTRASILEKEA